MVEHIGFSFIEVATGNEVDWTYTLPWGFLEYPSGRVTLDKVGLEVPTSNNPTHRLVERWLIDAPPNGYQHIGYHPAVYNPDNDHAELRGIYELIPAGNK